MPSPAETTTELGAITRHCKGGSWWATAPGDDIATPHRTRREATERLAQCAEVRAMGAKERERREAARTVAPDGWRFASWDDVQHGDTIRTPRKCQPVDPGTADSPLSPVVWGDPVTLTGVRDLGNGCIVASGTDRRGNPAWLGMGVLLLTPQYRAVGVLVPEASALPGHPGHRVPPVLDRHRPRRPVDLHRRRPVLQDVRGRRPAAGRGRRRRRLLTPRSERSCRVDRHPPAPVLGPAPVLLPGSLANSRGVPGGPGER